jgi:hypothetical protein
MEIEKKEFIDVIKKSYTITITHNSISYRVAPLVVGKINQEDIFRVNVFNKPTQNHIENIPPHIFESDACIMDFKIDEITYIADNGRPFTHGVQDLQEDFQEIWAYNPPKEAL